MTETLEPGDQRYVPAAGRSWLTGLYDPVMALTMREGAFRPALVEAALESQPRLLVDLGCGTGTLSAALAGAARELTVIGLDGDPQVLARAREKCARFGSRVSFSQGLADSIPSAAGTVDTVVASLLLHHLTRGAKLLALAEARRVLSPTGRLVIADWGQPHDPLMRAAFLGLQLLDGFANTADHAAGRLPALIAAAGFQTPARVGRWRTAWGSLEILSAAPRA